MKKRISSTIQILLRIKASWLQPCVFTVFFVLTAHLSPAQFSLTGKVTDSTTKPLASCNVLLYKMPDTNFVKGALCSTDGSFFLKNVSAGSYLVRFSFADFKTTWLPVNISTGSKALYETGAVILSPASHVLQNVTVAAKKPLFEQKIDRLVVNVKNSITSAGGTVLEVLQKSPGVLVNRQDGTITMSGKTGVQIMINGKLNYMPATALFTMLEGMSANNVEQIELITTPPAKYDAGGNAGYINIVLVQNPNEGFNGSYFLTMAAWHGTFPAAGFDFNFRKKKINLYGSYTASRKAQVQIFTNERRINYQNKITEVYNFSRRDPSQLNFNARMGLDYQLSKKTTIGVLAAGYNNRWHMDAFNNFTSRVNNMADTSIGISNEEINHWKHAMVNINLQHTTSQGGDISVNADYLYYDNYNPTDYFNEYYDGAGQFLNTTNLKSSKRTIIKIFPLQFDYKIKLNAKTEMEAGVKSVFSKFTNDVLVAQLEQNSWKPDPAFTADYLLKENIAAGYTSVSIKPNTKNTIKAGLRYEYTFSNLGTEDKKNIVDRKYGYLFPTIFLGQKINDNNSINFSYNRRINRPEFNSLAPFLIFQDPSTITTGNAALQPAIADGIKVDYSLRKIIFSAGYTYEKYTITRFQTLVDTASNKQYQVPQNLNWTKSINTLVSLSFSPASWWKSYINVLGIWQKVKADFLKTPVQVTNIKYDISGAQNFSFSKNYSAELSGFYRSASLSGIAKVKAFGQLNIAAQKKFNRSSVKFGVDDLFSTLKIIIIADIPEQNFYRKGTIYPGGRIFKLTFTANFGNKILKEKRMRSTASDAERQRVTQ